MMTHNLIQRREHDGSRSLSTAQPIAGRANTPFSTFFALDG
jgi:hypothetical protein